MFRVHSLTSMGGRWRRNAARYNCYYISTRNSYYISTRSSYTATRIATGAVAALNCTDHRARRRTSNSTATHMLALRVCVRVRVVVGVRVHMCFCRTDLPLHSFSYTHVPNT